MCNIFIKKRQKKVKGKIKEQKKMVKKKEEVEAVITITVIRPDVMQYQFN